MKAIQRSALWPGVLAAQLVLAGAAFADTAANTPADCGADFDPRHRRSIETSRHRLVFQPQPAPLVSGRHFGLDIQVCAKEGASLPVALRVDADMPEHRHGMNYKPSVRVLGPGRYRAEGLLLHMPGRWRLLFELSADGRLDRLEQISSVP